MATKIARQLIFCACGCGNTLIDRNKKGNLRRFIKNHHMSNTDSRAKAAERKRKRGVKTAAWNKGLTYVIKKKTEYANGGAWNKAMRRLYENKCMRCGWNEASCDTHHIIHKKNGGRRSLENGIILCPNCHRLANIGIISIDQLLAIKANYQPKCIIV